MSNKDNASAASRPKLPAPSPSALGRSQLRGLDAATGLSRAQIRTHVAILRCPSYQSALAQQCGLCLAGIDAGTPLKVNRMKYWIALRTKQLDLGSVTAQTHPTFMTRLQSVVTELDEATQAQGPPVSMCVSKSTAVRASNLHT